jgi:hypothetical protein
MERVAFATREHAESKDVIIVSRPRRTVMRYAICRGRRSIIIAHFYASGGFLHPFTHKLVARSSCCCCCCWRHRDARREHNLAQIASSVGFKRNTFDPRLRSRDCNLLSKWLAFVSSSTSSSSRHLCFVVFLPESRKLSVQHLPGAPR